MCSVKEKVTDASVRENGFVEGVKDGELEGEALNPSPKGEFQKGYTFGFIFDL